MKISFCIPTYNHANFIGSALDAILAQAPENFEIVIVDGASTDNTPEVVESYRKRVPNIVYYRCPKNRGIDPDIAECVARATGDYCWLASSDDIIPPGVVAMMLKRLESADSLYIGARAECTKDMKVFAENYVFDSPSSQRWNFADEDSLVQYLETSHSLIALFSYISVLVFKKELWDAGGDNPTFQGTCYAHAHRLWRALGISGGTVNFVREVLVMCRMDNDNFSSRGTFNRFMLDFDGFLRIADDVFGQRHRVREAFHGAIRREHSVFRLARFYGACTDAAQRRQARVTVANVGYPWIERTSMRLLGRTGRILDAAVTMRRVVRRSMGRFRFETG